ncbi:dnj-29 [Pristionchus pacificus]|uniref:Dnj-29 n=1 Tax=Pristionchus pacificus TaxID=54126 RepID=A0A2A6CEL0_PRIPA|nr:dnj-29 [Pristionchus pacificus]|eukprot:PDM76493.1 dnj-29 [Pristionchus pacificus]
MGRAEFEYDEVGNTFYYVMLAFYSLILIPCTYFFFPHDKQVEEKVDERLCQCEGDVDKRRRKAAIQPWRKTKKVVSFVVLAVAWVVLAFLVQKVASIENTHVEYDPYSILELDHGASTAQIKKAYRDMSKKFHPDKGGDAIQFDRVAKAYQALTDDASRENWEKYGNPDGPTATQFGIALPKWLVSKEYGVWVLAFYGFIFMILLPTGVGYWWYNSIKYNVDKVLLDTTQLFGYFTRKTPRMEIHRAIMVLGGAFEFNKEYNNEIILREADDVELPRLMKHLPLLGENKKERPLCLPYSIKARIMLHAHLSRQVIEHEDILFDQRYFLSRTHRLIEEMLSIAQQINYYTSTKIPIETIDNLIKLFPMMVQALWPKNSVLLQLPHINDYNINYIRRQKVNSCSDLAKLDNEKRRQVLNSLTDAQYRDVIIVLTSMPRLHIETAFEVPGEDDAHEITAGCFVTLKVKLTRLSLLDPAAADDDKLMKPCDENDEEVPAEKVEDEEGETPATPNVDVKNKKKAWEKQPQKKKGGAKKKTTNKGAKKVVASAVASTAAAAAAESETPATPDTPKDAEKKKERREKREEESADESGGSASEDEDKDSADEASCASPNDESDEDDWVAETKKPVLEAKSYETHPVHCPFYPGEKFEWWWLTLSFSEKKGQRRLIAPVTSCKTLVKEQTVEIRFPAPETKGSYMLQLGVQSDSYIDCNYAIDIKMEVKPAKEVVLPKYEDTEDEAEGEPIESSDEYTEESDDE